MNKQTQKQKLDAFTKKMEDVMISKSGDYATEDTLSNFKLVSQIVGIPIEKVIMVFIATKTVRLGNLQGTPNNESIEDNSVDLANYSVLLDMVRNEDFTEDTYEPKVGDFVMIKDPSLTNFKKGDIVERIEVNEKMLNAESYWAKDKNDFKQLITIDNL